MIITCTVTRLSSGSVADGPVVCVCIIVQEVLLCSSAFVWRMVSLALPPLLLLLVVVMQPRQSVQRGAHFDVLACEGTQRNAQGEVVVPVFVPARLHQGRSEQAEGLKTR